MARLFRPLLFIILLFSPHIIRSFQIYSFPWSESYESRQEQLLRQMREVMFLEMDGNVTPKVLFTPQQMVSQGGEVYTVQALPETEYDPLGRPTAKPSVPGDGTSPIYDQKTLMSALKNKCLHYQTDPPSWWTTEWCHRKEIRQFHLQLVPLTPSDPATPLPHSTKMRQERNPDYSLGKFERSVIVREGGSQSVGNKSVPIIKVIDYFVNGQPCDELKGRRVNSRQTEVHFECCTDSFPSQQALPHLQELGSTSPSPDLYIRSFEELSICKYRMTVCMTALCSQQRLAQILAPKVTSLASILQSLRDSGTCLLLQESWWTYELCFHTDLRQYHASTQLMATTIPVAPASTPPSATTHLSLGEGIGAVIEAGERREVRVEVLVKEPSYVLGIAPSIPKSSSSSSSPSGTDNDVEKDLQTFIRPIPLFKKSTGSGSSSSPSSLSSGMGLLLQFKEGTLCDASSSQSSSGSPAAKVAGNKVRSTDVYLTCAAKNSIHSITEDTTCHYIMEVGISALCAFDQFTSPKQKISRVLFRKENEAARLVIG